MVCPGDDGKIALALEQTDIVRRSSGPADPLHVLSHGPGDEGGDIHLILWSAREQHSSPKEKLNVLRELLGERCGIAHPP